MKTSFEIQNLKCGGCANTIINRLSKVKGLNDIAVDNETHKVSFNYNNESAVLEAKQLLAALGYPVVGGKNSITTKAKSFASCAIGRINKS